MSDFINTIDIIGDDALMDGLIERSIGSFSDDKITRIRTSAFRLYTNLESVSFPNATAIGDGAFYGSGLKAITPETFPLMTSVGGDSFSTGVFRESTLETVDWPSLERTTNGKMFYGCKSLVNVNLPNLTNVSADMFISCTALETITLPLITAVSCTFDGCTGLRVIDLPSCTSIDWRRTFANCYILDALILRSTTMCAITGSLVGNDYFRPFSNSGISNGTGYIYVPRDLVESYKADTNWSEFAAQFRHLEDYTVDGTTTGAMREHCESLSLNVTELTFTDVNSQTLTTTGELGIYDSYVWSASDCTVAKVKNGVVTPICDGTATITVTCGEYSATCTVTVNAGLDVNILRDIGFNTGYLSNNGAATTSSNADTYTDKFDISTYVGESIEVQLIDVTNTASNSRICYYDSSNTSVGYTQAATASYGAVITSTVPDNAVYAAISVNKSGGFSAIDICYNNERIGYIEYTS